MINAMMPQIKHATIDKMPSTNTVVELGNVFCTLENNSLFGGFLYSSIMIAVTLKRIRRNQLKKKGTVHKDTVPGSLLAV
jgi:hypothetical protein